MLATSAIALCAVGCGRPPSPRRRDLPVRLVLVNLPPKLRPRAVRGEQSGGGPERTYCEFVLRDGRRFKCLGRRSERSYPNASELANDKACAPLSTLPVPVVPSRLLTVMARARACLTNRGFRVTGGTVEPGGHPPGGPEGELIAGNGSGGAFIAFCADSRRAERFEPELIPYAHRFGGQVERRGAITVLWTRPPGSDLRTRARACAFT